jgi:hypothetical protein
MLKESVNDHIKNMNELRQRLLERREKLFGASTSDSSEIDPRERNDKVHDQKSHLF